MKEIWVVWQEDCTHEYDDSVYEIFDTKEEADKFADALNQKMIDWELKTFKRITKSWRYYVEDWQQPSSAEEALEKHKNR